MNDVVVMLNYQGCIDTFVLYMQLALPVGLFIAVGLKLCDVAIRSMSGQKFRI